MLNKGYKRNFAEPMPVILSMKIFAHCREVSQFQMGKTLEGIFSKYCENHTYTKKYRVSRCLLYNVSCLCVRRDPGGASRGPGEQLRGAVAPPPARDSHPRHTVDRPGEAAHR